VRAGLEGLVGVEKADYDARRSLFHVRFDASCVGVAAILASVRVTGKKMGRDYLPEVAGS
jgi:hypothetical protein